MTKGMDNRRKIKTVKLIHACIIIFAFSQNQTSCPVTPTTPYLTHFMNTSLQVYSMHSNTAHNKIKKGPTFKSQNTALDIRKSRYSQPLS